MKFPKHKYGLYLSHNEHKTSFETIEQFVEFGCCIDHSEDWVSEEEKQKAIKEDSLWTLQWYPKTAVGFYKVYASSLEVVLKAARAVEIEEKEV